MVCVSLSLIMMLLLEKFTALDSIVKIPLLMLAIFVPVFPLLIRFLIFFKQALFVRFSFLSAMLGVIVLLYAVGCVQSAKSKRIDGDLVQRDFPIALPVTGFISVKSAFDTVMIKIVRKVNSPGFCKTIELINQPKPNTSPFVGSSEFTLVTDKLYNNHYAWYNGAEYISFIPTEGVHGNWLIGNDPGVDNGYVYLATNAPSLTPINLESTEEDYQWKWLLNMKWKAQPQMRAVCKDTYKPGNVYYEIEYFDQVTREAVKSALVPDLNPYILSLHNQLNQRFDQTEFLSKQSNLLIPFPSYFDQSSRTWKLLEGITVVAEFGSPVLITRSKQQTGTTESHVGILVNEEHSGKLGWRLAFKNYPLSSLSVQAAKKVKSNSDTDTAAAGGESITQVSYRTPTDAVVTTNSIATHNEKETSQPFLDSDSEEVETEYTVELDNAGCLDDYRVTPLTPALRKEVQRATQQALDAIRPGEYMWIWYSTIPNPPKGSGVTVSAEGGLTFTAPALQNYDNDWQTDDVSELLLRCKSRSNGTLVFQYFLTDRRDVMKQSYLERDTDFLVMKLATTSSGTYIPPVVTFRGRNVQLKALVVLGSDILNYLRRFLLKKEGATHGLSSCYMYHAAVSMPQALIYAAEILCVLLGSKPIAMVGFV